MNFDLHNPQSTATTSGTEGFPQYFSTRGMQTENKFIEPDPEHAETVSFPKACPFQNSHEIYYPKLFD